MTYTYICQGCGKILKVDVDLAGFRVGKKPTKRPTAHMRGMDTLIRCGDYEPYAVQAKLIGKY